MADADEPTIYDEIEIEDMTYDATTQMYHYPCPCGDKFEIALVDLLDEADIAVCPSCSLMVRVIFEVVSISPPFSPLSLERGGGVFGGRGCLFSRLGSRAGRGPICWIRG